MVRGKKVSGEVVKAVPAAGEAEAPAAMVRLAGAATAALKLAFGAGPLAMIGNLSEKASELERQRTTQRQFANEQRSARADLSRDAGGFEGGGDDDEWEDVEDVSGSRARVRPHARARLARVLSLARSRPNLTPGGDPPRACRRGSEAAAGAAAGADGITSFAEDNVYARAGEWRGDKRVCKPICPPRP